MRHQTIIYLAFFFSFATYANSNLILKKTINPFYKKSLIAIENENKRGILLNNFENELYKKISLDKIDTRINKRLVKNPVSNVALWVNWKTKVKERLSSTSKEVLDLYPRLGKRAIYLGLKAHLKTVKLYGKNNLYLNKADAFRHTYWNALMVKYINYEFATLWSVSHEIHKENQQFSDKNTEMFMDILNNTAGRLIGEKHMDETDSELIDIVSEEIERGNLYKLENSKTRRLVFTDE